MHEICFFLLIHVDSLVFVMVISPDGSVVEVNNSTCDLRFFCPVYLFVNDFWVKRKQTTGDMRMLFHGYTQ